MKVHTSNERELLKETLHKQFENYLGEKGLRQTAGRFLILDKCVDQRVHFDIQHLYDDIHRDFSVSLASVYNTVELLCDCGIIRKQYLRENQASYEVAGENHLHLICLECGSVEVMEIGERKELDYSKVRRLIASGDHRQFVPSFMSANVYGICSACKSRN